MNNNIKIRTIKEANTMIKTNKTIRQLAKEYKVSKSTVHKDLKERLKYINEQLYEQVKRIIKKHIEERHIKGGQATQKKYQKINKNI